MLISFPVEQRLLHLTSPQAYHNISYDNKSATNSFATIFGLPDQTVTNFPPTVTAGEIQYAPYQTGSILPPLYTATVTEVNAFVQAHGGTVQTRVTCDETGNATVPTLAY